MKQKLFTLFAAVIIAANAMAQDVSAFTNQTITVEGVSFKMIAVEGGTFTMGATSEQGSDAYDNEKPTHSVTLSDYYIGETEVTQALWYAVMGYKPTSGGSQWSSNYGLGDNYPAYYISWDDCQAFITKLNTLTGKTFRMPTEAEWEYAARGGNKSKGYKYSGSNTIDDVAWYYDNSGIKSHTVGTKAANELGIYDMSGNLWEWCSDWYSRSYYSSSAQTNPTGPSSGSGRVRRGGYWYNSARTCRVSYRNNFAPSHCDIVIGLRLVLVPYYNIIVTASEGGTATGDGKYNIGETATLTATPNEYYEFEKWSDGNTENPRTITVTQDSVFEAIFVENPKYTITLHAENGTISGAESGKQYYEGTALTLTATPNQGYTFAQWSDGNTDNPRTITVTQDSTFTAVFEEITPEYVDLGLPSGTLWATCNVGATAPEQAGDYFAWGETEPKENYDWTNEGDYKWGVAKWNGETYEGMTKYNNEDGLLTLEAADDAATANWGGKWRTPTQKEMQELLDECQRDWTTDYNGTGKAGYIITSKAEGNTNAIFLPAAGYYDQSYLTLVGSQGYYWSSSLYEESPSVVNVLYFGSDFYIGSFNRRCSGYSVRPVCSKDGILTGVETPYIASPDQVRKVMENGTMYIIHDGVRYNVLGVKVK